MTEGTSTSCVLIPCSDTENWAVPQACLAEIHVVNSTSKTPPKAVEWRGQKVPVMDLGEKGAAPWGERRVGTGLVAIFLGLEGAGCDYWGVAVRGEGLAVARLSSEEISDASGEALEHAASAFKYNDVLYQVPDLDGLQQRIATSAEAA